MTDPSFMARFGARLVTNGYAILPIAPGTKKPGQFKRGAWADYPEWNRHAERGTTEVEVTTWSSWPDCGIGIVGGAVAAVDIDIVEDVELALQIEQLARARLGDTPALRIGRAPKRMLVYRTAQPFRGIKRHPLEVLCLGQQFLAYAIHPDIGAPYVWPEEGLADIDITDLPEISVEAAMAFLDEAYALLPESLRQRGLAALSPAVDIARSHSQIGTLPAIEAALAWLPNSELDYDSWMRVGMALKGALGEEGADLFAHWSAQAAKDVPAITLKAWASFKPDRIGAGTIYHLAMERGWQPDPDLRLDGSLPEEADHPAAGLLAKLDVTAGTASAPRAGSPFSLAIPDGLVGDLTDYMLSTARRPQPLLSLGASLCAIGALMGRNYRTTSNLRSNLYVVAVATAAGTTTALALQRFGHFNGSITRNGAALGNIISAEVTYSNGLDRIETIRSDGRIEGADPGMAALTGRMEVRFADTTLITQALDGTPCELVFAWSLGASASFTFTAHAVYLPRPRIEIPGPQGIQATFDWQAAKATSPARLCTAVLVNTVVGC